MFSQILDILDQYGDDVDDDFVINLLDPNIIQELQRIQQHNNK
jgi:hypothetical protein